MNTLKISQISGGGLDAHAVGCGALVAYYVTYVNESWEQEAFADYYFSLGCQAVA